MVAAIVANVVVWLLGRLVDDFSGRLDWGWLLVDGSGCCLLAWFIVVVPEHR